MKVPRQIEETRRAVCEQSCTEHCQAYSSKTLNHSDHAAACPRKGWILAWGCFGPCDGSVSERIKPQRGLGDAVATVAQPALESASVITKFSRLRKEVSAWLRAGAPLVSRIVRKARLSACCGCEYHSPSGNLGMGECRYPGCGCTRIKAALATSRCPANPSRWPA